MRTPGLCRKSNARPCDRCGSRSQDHSPHILEQYEEVHGVGRGRDEVEMLVEAPGFLIFCMHGHGAYTGYVRRLQCALDGVSQERLADAPALPAAIDGKPRE